MAKNWRIVTVHPTPELFKHSSRIHTPQELEEILNNEEDGEWEVEFCAFVELVLLYVIGMKTEVASGLQYTLKRKEL